ncbi:hypothetical protein PG984_006831 [Apiospora sp. TS-2023a]
MATDKYLDLAKVPQQPDLEPSAFHPYQGIEIQSNPGLAYTQQQNHQQQQKHHHHSGVPDSGEKDAPTTATDNSRRRILGLTIPVFWGLLIALVLVIAGAIGGGLAAQGRSNNNNNTEPSGSGRPSSGAAGEATSSSKPTPAQQPADESASVTMLLPIVQVSAVPLDGGCPKINGTRYIPREPTNDTITATESAAAAGIILQVYI